MVLRSPCRVLHRGAVRKQYKCLGRKTGKQETIWEAYDGRIILYRGSILCDISQPLSLRPYRVTAGGAALAALPLFRGLGFRRLSSLHCSLASHLIKSCLLNVRFLLVKQNALHCHFFKKTVFSARLIGIPSTL